MSITIATLSLYRYDLLFRSLEHNPTTTSAPLNICLRVQAAEEMPFQKKIKVLELLDVKYNNYDVQFTYKNHGSGVPRHDVVHRALDHFNAKFVLTLDDDILMPKGGIDALVKTLIENPKIGSVGLAYEPHPIVWMEKGNSLRGYNPQQGLSFVSAIGSGTTMTRREVFDKCDLDTEYYIGWGDMDFCKQVTTAGWKVAMLNLPNLKAVNHANHKNKTSKYYNVRYNKQHIANSKERYFKKWGVKIGG